MDNYHPMYETISYNVSTKQPEFGQEKYATLLPETQLKEDESTAYQQPIRSNSHGDRGNRKSRTKLKILCITVWITVVAVILLVLLVTSVLLRKSPTKLVELHQIQTENCTENTVNCMLRNYKSTCNTDEIKLHAPVSKLFKTHDSSR